MKNRRFTLVAAFAAMIMSNAHADDTVYAKLVDGTFAYYEDLECETPVETPETGIEGCVVLFANDAEYQALVPYTNELATAVGGIAYLQNDLTLTGDTDWRAMDFDLNGKVITLHGYDLAVRRPKGEGRITAGNLIINGDFDTSDEGWTLSSSTWRTGSNGSSSNNKPYSGNIWLAVGTSSGSVAAKQTFSVAKTQYCYVRFRYSKYNSTYVQYLGIGIDANANIIGKNSLKSSGGGAGTNSSIYKRNLSAGEHTFYICRWNGYALIDEITVSPTSYLTFDIPEGEEYDNTSITLGSTQDYFFDGMGLQVRKTGKGKLTMSKVNNRFGGNGITSMVVEEGQVVKMNGATCGASYSNIKVEDGAQFDLNGRTFHDYDYTLAGAGPDGTGALTSSAELDEDTAAEKNTSTSFLRNVTLADDATVYAHENMGMIFYNYDASTMTMNGHTITYDGVGDRRIFSGSLSYSGTGKIIIATNGWFQTREKTVSAGGCDLEVYGKYWQDSGGLSPVNSFVFRTGSEFCELSAPSAAKVVYSVYAPPPVSTSNDERNHCPKVQLGDSDHLVTTLDLSSLTTFIDDSQEETLTFFEGSTVTVELGDREAFDTSALWKWAKIPDGVTFIRSEKMRNRGFVLLVLDTGLYFAPGAMVIVR